MTPYHLYGLLRLNEAAKKAGYRGGFVCHHGTEQENVFYAEVDKVYTVFTPSGRVHAVPPEFLEFFLTEIDLLGHVFYTNPSYVLQREARFQEQAFSKKTTKSPEGKSVVEKIRVDSLTSRGVLESKEVDAIFYYSRHRERLFNHLLEKKKEELLIENLFEELTNIRPERSPLEDYYPLVDKWMALMGRPTGHHAQKTPDSNKPRMTLTQFARTKRFAQRMRERSMSLPQLLAMTPTEDKELHEFALWVKETLQRQAVLQGLLDESRFNPK